MSSKLKVIALISGGKDSLFSILHCLKNGHDLVALANLYPPHAVASANDDEGEDINSFMYQTVGHTVIPLYEQALKLPLYRQPILGHAVVTDKDYHHQSQLPTPSVVPVDASVDDVEDETESLLPLLRRVVAAHPEANAVCTGAILSTYQRTRVESVCARLGLVSLGYLWQYPALPPYADAALLRDMAAVGQDARIIKVASGGMDDGFLWQNVADVRTIERLKRAAARFGGEGAVLGEGGEFETLAVDGPSCVWKGRIEVDVDEKAVIGEGGNALVRFKGAQLVQKTETDHDGLDSLRVPDLFDLEFDELGRHLSLNGPERASDSKTLEQSLAATSLSDQSTAPPIQSLDSYTSLHGSTLIISNLIAPSPTTPTAQLTAITTRLLALLPLHFATPANITSTTLLLRSMSLFTALNPIYGVLFSRAANPPARVTVACGSALPEGVDVALSCTVDLPVTDSLAPSRRRGLHVQSRSYWAPANIGPYSQAVAVPTGGAETGAEIVHLAGQIPLVPASMEMVTAADAPWLEEEKRKCSSSAFAVQAVLALQHLWRVGRVMGVRWWACGTAFVSMPESRAEGDRRALVAREVWRRIHEQLRPKDAGEEDEDADVVDVWDLKYGNAGKGFGGVGGGAPAAEVDGRPKLPAFEAVKWSRGMEKEGGDLVPPCVVVQVLELPRAADVEWTSPGLTNCGDVTLGRLEGSRTGLVVHETKAAGGTMSFYAAGVASGDDVWELDEILKSAMVPVEGRVYTLYAAGPLPQDWVDRSCPLVVPCGRVWGPDGKEVVAAVTVRYCQGAH
ncbi:atp-binding endoribonuclease [Diplodia corticola]|uniref:Diphthine--ammonia ligase n=1 Tax=Diplodia corticola TaxID=236234 RepID=A0A1J9S3N5_9PEZI|nr:atp-binding endoribonuclease [Diplodia corticola]OJD35167.1 atp-binding endoribonuclease [Diplodia corticola]